QIFILTAMLACASTNTFITAASFAKNSPSHDFVLFWSHHLEGNFAYFTHEDQSMLSKPLSLAPKPLLSPSPTSRKYRLPKPPPAISPNKSFNIVLLSNVLTLLVPL
ncbi:hypothetical protein SK128_008612, partial [Halocaridina rubra]